MLLGLFAVFSLPREEEPQISVPMFDIFVSFPGASAEEVERRIINLGERKLWELTGVEYLYSTAEDDKAFFTVRFKVGEDVEKSLIKLYTKVYSNLDILPAGASQPLIKLRSIDDVPILSLTFFSHDMDPQALRKTVASIQNSINAIPDVSETSIIGGRKRQFQVFFDQDKLRERILSPQEIAGQIQNSNVRVAAGHIETEPELINVETDAFFKSKSDLENLVVGVSQGAVVYLKDVANVVDGPDENENYVDIRVREHGEDSLTGPFKAVTLAVSKRKGSNAAWLSEKILQKIDGMKGREIPQDVEFKVTRDYGETATEKSNELLLHMMIAVVGVAILIAFVLGFRESGVVAVAIPMTLALTLAVFYFLGFTLNRITLFALIFSIGILVDDPIVDVENIVRHLRMPRNKGKSILDVTIEAVNEVRSPLILATLTVIAAILPMAFVRGLMGPYMRPIPIGASIAMMFSMAVAFIATPWAAYTVLGRAHIEGKLKGHGEGEAEDLLTRIYRSYMRPLIYSEKVRFYFLLGMGLLLFLAVLLVPLKLVKVKMLPFDNKNEFQVILNIAGRYGYRGYKKILGEIAEELAKVKEVDNIERTRAQVHLTTHGLVRHYFLRQCPTGRLAGQPCRETSQKRQSHAIAKSVRPDIHRSWKNTAAGYRSPKCHPGRRSYLRSS
jgi:multidrug efflux pump subunit AcrB